MQCKDKYDGMSREGSGRIGIHLACGNLIHSYTVEGHYIWPKEIERLSRPKNILSGEVKQETMISDIDS